MEETVIASTSSLKVGLRLTWRVLLACVRGPRCGGQLVLDDVFQSTIPINTLLLRGLRHRLHALRRIVGREVNSSESGSIGTHQVHLHMFSAEIRRRTPLDGH